MSAAPSKAAIQVGLAENEDVSGVPRGVIAWLSMGLHIEETQFVVCLILNAHSTDKSSRLDLASHVRAHGDKPSDNDQITVINQRHALQMRIDSFQKGVETYFTK